MGFIARLAHALSPGTRRLARLAAIGGESERLAASLAQHAELCAMPGIKAGLQDLAAAEITDADALRSLILAHSVQPAPSPAMIDAGPNNWARLNADLAAEVELVRALTGAIAEWEGVEPAVAARLREIATSKERTLMTLRDFALKCDPQALD